MIGLWIIKTKYYHCIKQQIERSDIMNKLKVKVLSKHNLTIKDISILMDCGLSKASNYRKRFIEKKKLKSDYFGITILTSEFVDFYKIDVDMIRDNYLLDKKLAGDVNAART